VEKTMSSAHTIGTLFSWNLTSGVLLTLSAIAFTCLQVLITPRYHAIWSDDFAHLDMTGHYVVTTHHNSYELGWIVLGLNWFAALYYIGAAICVRTGNPTAPKKQAVMMSQSPFNSWTNIGDPEKAKQVQHEDTKELLQNHANWRWAAFALIYAASIWITATLAGVTNIVMLLLLSIIGIVVVACIGPTHDETVEALKGGANMTTIIWRSFSLGVLLFAVQLIAILIYLSEVAESGVINWSIYTCVIGAIVLSIIIGIVQGVRNHSMIEKTLLNEKIITVFATLLVLWVTWMFFGVTESLH
jgi:hypothetical protein